MTLNQVAANLYQMCYYCHGSVQYPHRLMKTDSAFGWRGARRLIRSTTRTVAWASRASNNTAFRMVFGALGTAAKRALEREHAWYAKACFSVEICDS